MAKATKGIATLPQDIVGPIVVGATVGLIVGLIVGPIVGAMVGASAVGGLITHSSLGRPIDVGFSTGASWVARSVASSRLAHIAHFAFEYVHSIVEQSLFSNSHLKFGASIGAQHSITQDELIGAPELDPLWFFLDR
jgi:hypothetical protein